MPFTATRPGNGFLLAVVPVCWVRHPPDCQQTAWSAFSSGSAAWLFSHPRKDRTPFTSQQRREAMLASATRVAVAPFRAVRGPSVRRTSRAVSSDAAAGEKFWDKMTKLASGAKDTETAVFALG